MMDDDGTTGIYGPVAIAGGCALVVAVFVLAVIGACVFVIIGASFA